MQNLNNPTKPTQSTNRTFWVPSMIIFCFRKIPKKEEKILRKIIFHV